MGGSKSGEETWSFLFTEKALRILPFSGSMADFTPGKRGSGLSSTNWEGGNTDGGAQNA